MHIWTDEARRIEMEEKGLGTEGARIMKGLKLVYARTRRVMDGKKVKFVALF